jgi:hypothetical protein
VPRRPGRPPLEENDPAVPVLVKLPSKVYDALFKRAQDERMSVPEAIRRDLREMRRAKRQES